MNSLNTLLLVAFVSGLACKSFRAPNTKTDQEPEWVEWVIKFERGPCFGDCPVYTFFLLDDHNGLIEVKRNLLEPGWYHADLDQEEVHEILMDLEPIAWWNEDLSQQPEIADLPSTSMLYKHKDGLRWMALQGRFSDSISRVLQKINHLVTEARWQPTTLRPLNPDLPEPTNVIVQLKDGVNVHEWMKKYETYGINLVKRVTPKMQFYVVSKNPGMGSANDFLQYIKLDPDVIEAQWDRAVAPRQ